MTLSQWKNILIELDKIGSGWKTFFALIVALIGLYVMPEGKAQYIVATMGIVAAGLARGAKVAADKQ